MICVGGPGYHPDAHIGTNDLGALPLDVGGLDRERGGSWQ